MNNRKGLSQILFLIIAASVLMIAALSLVFMLDEGLSGIIEFGGDATASACERQGEAACSGTTGQVEAPSACIQEGPEGDDPSPTQGVNSPDFTIQADDRQLDCQQ